MRTIRPTYGSGEVEAFWHDARMTEGYTINTGPITKAEAIAYQDALLRKMLYWIVGSDYKILKIQDKEWRVTGDWEDLHSYSIKVVASMETSRYSGIEHKLTPAARWSLVEEGLAGNQTAAVAAGTEISTGTMEAYFRGYNPDGSPVTTPDNWRIVVDLCDDDGAIVTPNYAWAIHNNSDNLVSFTPTSSSANWATDIQAYLNGFSEDNGQFQFAKKLYSDDQAWKKCGDTAKSLKFRLFVTVDGIESTNADNTLTLPWHLEEPEYGNLNGADHFERSGYLYIMWYDYAYGLVKLWRNDGVTKNVATITGTSSHGYIRIDQNLLVNGWPVLYLVKGDNSIVTLTATAAVGFCTVAYGNETTIKAAETVTGSFMFTLDIDNRQADGKPRLYYLNNDTAGRQSLYHVLSVANVWQTPVQLLFNIFTATGGGYTREAMRCDSQGYVWILGSGAGGKSWKVARHNGVFAGWTLFGTYLLGATTPFGAVIINEVFDGFTYWPEFFEGVDRAVNYVTRYDLATGFYRIAAAASGTGTQSRVHALAYHNGKVYHGCRGGGDYVIMAYDVLTNSWEYLSGTSGVLGNDESMDY